MSIMAARIIVARRWLRFWSGPWQWKVIADARRGNINQLENVFPFADSTTCLFWPAGFLESSFFPLSLKNGHISWASFCPLSLSPSPFPTYRDTHIYLYPSYLKFQSLSVCALCPSGDWCGILPLSYSGKIPDVRKLVSPPWLGHVVGQEVLHQALLNSLGACSSQPNGNKARRVERPSLHLHPPPAPEGSSQACAINFLTIYSQVEFIFPEQPHMWCISGFRLWGWGRRSWLWSQSIKVATNSVFLEGCVL